MKKQIASFLQLLQRWRTKGGNDVEARIQPSSYPDVVTLTLQTIFETLDADGDGVLRWDEVRTLEMVAGNTTTEPPKDGNLTLSLEQFLCLSAPLVEAVDVTDPSSVEETCQQLRDFFEPITKAAPPRLEVLDFPERILQALGSAYKEIFDRRHTSSLVDTSASAVPKMGVESPQDQELHALQRKRIDAIAQRIGTTRSDLLQCAQVAASDPELSPKSPDGEDGVPMTSFNPIFSAAKWRPPHRFLQLWEPFVSRYDHYTEHTEESPITPQSTRSEAAGAASEGTCECEAEIGRIAAWVPPEEPEELSGVEILKRINRLKTRLREVGVLKRRRADLVLKYSLVDKKQKQLDQLVHMRQELEHDPSSLKKQELAAREKKFHAQIDQARAEEQKGVQAAEARAHKACQQLISRSEKMLAVKCKCDDELVETVMELLLQRLGDSIGDEVAKLETEEQTATDHLDEVEEEEEEHDGSSQLAMKQDEGAPTSEVGQLKAQCAELSELVSDCRDLNNELRSAMRMSVESACSSGPKGGLAMLLWAEILRLQCFLLGIGKVAIGDALSPERGTNPADVMLMIMTRVGPAAEYGRLLLSSMQKMQAELPLFCEEELDGHEALQVAQDRLHHVYLEAGSESLQNHRERINKVVAALELKLEEQAAQGESEVSEEEMTKAIKRIEEQIGRVTGDIEAQKGVLDKQWNSLVSEAGEETAEGLRDLEADLEAQLVELQALEPADYVPIASQR